MRETFFTHQTSDIVFKVDTKLSSKGESLSHGIRDMISIGCFNFLSFSGPETAAREKDNASFAVYGLQHLQCTNPSPLNSSARL